MDLIVELHENLLPYERRATKAESDYWCGQYREWAKKAAREIAILRILKSATVNHDDPVEGLDGADPGAGSINRLPRRKGPI